MAAETKLDKLAVARLKAQLARNKAASQAQLQLAQADEQEANLSAMQKFRDTEKKRIEREAAAKAKLRQQGEGKAAPAPQLSPPSPINVENPASNLSSSPLSMPNFGQPGGPQPGSPGQQGGGGLAPFLQSQTQTNDMSLQETTPGVRQFVPSQRTSTTTEPNVLSAADAMRGANYRERTGIMEGRDLLQQVEMDGTALGNQLFMVREKAPDKVAEMRQAAFEGAKRKFGPEGALRVLAQADNQIAKIEISLRKSAIQGAMAAGRQMDQAIFQDYLTRGRAEEAADRRQRELAEDPIVRLKRRVAEIKAKPETERTEEEELILFESNNPTLWDRMLRNTIQRSNGGVSLPE